MNPPSRPALVPSTRFLLGAWILLGVMLLVLLGNRDVARAQEARVLETARQMLDAPLHQWLIPQLNGEPRVRKPPLCYWYTALSYKLFGVNEFAGRLPTVILGWLAVGATFLLGRDIAGKPVPEGRDILRGFFAAAALASSFHFIRFSRSAETDLPTLLGGVVAVWAILRSLSGSKHWLHLAALGIGFSALTKGPPAIYPVLFLIALCIARRTVEPAQRFVTSGAIVPALVLSLGWWLYVLSDPSARQVAQELSVIATGASHDGSPLDYFPYLWVALLPWTPIYLAGFLCGLFLWKRDETFRTTFYAILSIFLPLMVTPQVQAHYLVPMVPFCCIVTAWMMTRTIDGEMSAGFMTLMRWIVRVCVVVVLVGGPIALGVGYFMKRRVEVVDVLAMLALFGAGLVMLLFFRRRSEALQLAAWATLMLVVMPILIGWWAPTLDGYRSRELARAVEAHYEGRPMLKFGDDANIALSFNLRQAIPLTDDPAVVGAFLRSYPDGVVIVERDRESRSRSPLPYLLEEASSERAGDDVIEFYTLIDDPVYP